MKRFLLICLTFALIIPLVYSISLAGNANNLPSGPRYMLNVIAFDNCPAGDFTDSNRHMIAVKADYRYYRSRKWYDEQPGRYACKRYCQD